jgi:hypothetical protein
MPRVNKQVRAIEIIHADEESVLCVDLDKADIFIIRPDFDRYPIKFALICAGMYRSLVDDWRSLQEMRQEMARLLPDAIRYEVLEKHKQSLLDMRVINERISAALAKRAQELELIYK